MNRNPKQFDERFIELLVLASTDGLNEAQKKELDQLSTLPKHADEAMRFELTAAAINLSLDPNEPDAMPRSVQDRLLLAAGKHFSGTVRASDSESSLGSGQSEDKVQLANRTSASNTSLKRSRLKLREFLMLAVAAASLLVLLSGFNPFAKSDSGIAKVASASERLAMLTSSKPADLIDLNWSPVHDADASGKVIWSDERQEGYMVFSNLDVNDPSVEQYQLWIFDTDKGQAHPVDGGVFNIVSGSKDVVVPINSHLPVGKAVQFAVTIEKPGGVTVSERKRIPVLAAVE